MNKSIALLLTVVACLSLISKVYSCEALPDLFLYGYSARGRSNDPLHAMTVAIETSNVLDSDSFAATIIEEQHLKDAPKYPFWDVFSPPFKNICLLTQEQVDETTFTEEEDFGILETQEGKEFKTILAWHYAYGKSFEFGLGHKPFEAACCKEKRCFMTTRRDKIPVENFDAVIFHFLALSNRALPETRSEHQRYIFYELEPPPKSGKDIDKFKNFFNWTMTYRQDSDIFTSYGFLFPKEIVPTGSLSLLKRNMTSIESLIKEKKQMAVWLVSHCSTTSQREIYVTRLRDYIEVDIYGECGPLRCGDNVKECFQDFEKNYKFYLSFENNLCTDYITEKFFNAMRYNIVPVVLGSGDYASIAPPHSYIDVRDFKNEKELADYLIYLDKNDTAYMEYFTWKNDFIFPFDWIQGINFCTLCEKLHADTKKKTYPDLSKWFYSEAKCHRYYD